ncbi:MAG: hypothetical protein COV91_04490 [Candidatus Taylorbacteria bacterium CG11_big_fil_rev_8_21_14_0_20_46_11]|uniref:HD/PDEase domain-containing protein n=1 Tax=Candidatus Taylorbacteria bacterium CG11_big_fil_rev_8_21_14_0_20_46_11 TaxID=1975025 RepID=A0A2H0KAS7_9BACT|nr:MAG: hypothetical protein COV91_04490 [Candidatus Taylorbacteria bacterium CG11_big_fil_rev_8_21_14_0_20_46_11]
MDKKEQFEIPDIVAKVAATLEKAGFEAYLIGGCVRDLLIGRKPKDWDITTNAVPEEIVPLFDKTFYENEYGTVGVVTESAEESKDVSDETLKVIEITPYRKESEYSDNRRPDSVTFSKNLEDDLSRRDFTINAIALKIVKKEKEGLYKGQLTDIYKGQTDIDAKIIRAVGSADERFKEDALRTLRAVRLASELDFEIEENTEKAIQSDGYLLKNISMERIRDEFARIIDSDSPMRGLQIAHKLGILQYILPEIEAGIDVGQNKAHSFDVWEHSLRTLQHSAKKKFSQETRLAALFHDIGKPKTKRWSPEKKEWTFYGHDVVGSRVTEKALRRLKFPVKTIEKVSKLVRWHMFFSDTEQISLSAVRRLLAKVGKENVWDLMDVRVCDRIGTGRPKEEPYRLRKYQSMIEEVMRDPVTVGMLKINGSKIIDVTQETPGPRIGFILHALLEEVLEKPSLNTDEYMENRAKELSKLSDGDLKELGEKGKEKKEGEESKEIEEIRRKYWVK